jgi:hypothetical protein
VLLSLCPALFNEREEVLMAGPLGFEPRTSDFAVQGFLKSILTYVVKLHIHCELSSYHLAERSFP